MWELCGSCHLDKWIEPGELVCHACATRGMGPPPETLAGRPLTGARALRLMEPADTRSEREAVAYVEERARLARGDIRTPDDALRWLGEHVTISHEYGS